MSTRDRFSLPARFLAVGLIAFFAGRATRAPAPTADAADRAPARAVWREHGGRELVELVFDGPAPAPGRDAAESPPAPAFAIDGVAISRVEPAGADSIALVPAASLPRARRLEVELLANLPLADGTSIRKGARWPFTTPGPRVIAAIPARVEADGGRVFRLAFDLPIAFEALEAALAVFAPDGEPLPRVIEALPLDGDAANDVGPHSVAADPRPASVTEFDVTIPGDSGRARTERAKVVLAPTLRSTIGKVPLSGAREFAIDFLSPLAVEDVSVTPDAIVVEFGFELGPIDASLVELEPATPHRVSRRWSGGLAIEAEYRPGERYVVRLGRGFPGEGFARLREPVALPVTIPDSPPSVAFSDRAIVLSAHARPEIAVAGVNVGGIVLRGKRVLDHNAVHFLRQRSGSWRADPDAAFSGRWKESIVPIAAGENEEFSRVLDLEPILGPSPRGLFLLELEDDRGASYPRHALLAITDLRATLRVDGDRALVCVSSVATGEAIEGARVEVLSRSNRRLGEARTDARGIAIFPCASDPEDPPFCVLAGLGDDRTFVDLDHFGVEDPGDDDARREFVAPGRREAFVASDRPVIRPGERATFAVVARDAALRAAPGPLRMRCFDGAENRREERVIEVPASGLASFEIETRETDPSGIWRIELLEAGSERSIGETTMQVASLALPRIEVDSRITGALRQGGVAAVEFSARWLSGAVLPHARAVVSARIDRPASTIDGSGFESGSAPFLGMALPAIETALDERGARRVEFALPGLDRVEGAQDAVLRVVVEVTEPDGRIVTRRAEAPLVAQEPRLSLKRDGDGLVVRLTDADGAPHPNTAIVAVEFAATRFTWQRDRRGRVHPVAERIVSSSHEVEVVAGIGRLEPRVAPERHGIVATARFAGRRVDLEWSAAAAPPDRLRVAVPEGPIARGARFPVVVESPVAGFVLLSLEGGGIHDATRFPVEPGVNEAVVTLPDLDLPSTLRVVASLAIPQQTLHEDASAAILVGSASLAVESSARVSAVALAAQETIEPGGSFELSIDAPGATEAIVAAVDAGALFSVARVFGDPIAFFTAPRRTRTLGADSAASLRRDARFDPRPRPGGDAPSDLVAALTEATGEDEAPAVVIRRVRLDDSGRARAAIDLSAIADYEGRLELVVLAAGPDRLAVGRAATTVLAPLSARLSGPRLLRGGDRAEFTLVVRNDTGADAEVRLDLTCDGPLALAAPAPGPVMLASGAATTLSLPVVADSEPDGSRSASVRVLAKTGAHERAVVRPCKVAPREPLVTRREAWAIVDPASATRRAGDGMRGKVVVRLELSPRPQARLAAAEATLADYPYGCTEQVASQVLARLGAFEFEAARPDGSEGRDAAEFVAAGLRKLVAAQRPSGAFSFWPGSGETDALPTIHACETLLAAAELGHPTPPGAIESGVRWLAEVGAKSDDELLAATAAELVARAGRPLPSAARRAAEGRVREARARAALAFARSGDRDAASAILRASVPHGEPAASSAIFPSSRRALALEVRAWLAAAPGDPRTHELATSLLDSLADPESWTTHELAHGLLAAREYFRAFASEPAPRRARITCGAAHRNFDTAGEPIAWEFETTAGAVIEVEADGPLFGRIETSGRSESRVSASRDLTIAREVRDLAGDLPLLPGEGLRRGGSYRGVVRLEAARDLGPVVVVAPIAAGCEPDHAIHVVSGSAAADASDGAVPTRVESRDGAALFFFDQLPAGRHEIRHVFRATTRGEYLLPAARALAMYEPGVFAQTESGEASVRR